MRGKYIIGFILGYVLISLIIGLIVGGAIAGSPTLIPTLPSQFVDKLSSLFFAFSLGCIPALIVFIGILVMKYIYLLLKIIINRIIRMHKNCIK